MAAALKLPGLFNVYNALAAAAVAWQYGLPGEAVSEGLSSLAAVPGRLEEIEAEGGFNVVIDFAHTPGAWSRCSGSCAGAPSAG